MPRFAVLLALLLTWTLGADAATWYVSTNGNDQNAGTQASPKRTVNAGIRLLKAGDTLYIRQGTYTEGIDSNAYGNNSFPVGTSWNTPVTIASAPNETATLRAGGSALVNLAHPYIQYVVFDRMIFDASQNEFALSIGNGTDYVAFENGEIMNASGRCDDPSHAGPNVILDGVGHRFRNSKIHDSKCSYGFYVAHTDGVLIDNCDIYNNYGYAIQIYDGSSASANNTIVRNTRMWNNGYGRHTAAMTISNGNNAMVYNNLIYKNNGGIDAGNNHTGAQIYNNTLVDNGYGIQVKSGNRNTKLANNIIYNSGTPVENQGSGSFAQSNNTLSDPRFVNPSSGDYRVQGGSPALQAAINMTQMFDKDILGVQRPPQGMWTTGAYHSGSAVLPVLAPPTNLRWSSAP